jgi:hypothetical protein
VPVVPSGPEDHHGQADPSTVEVNL